MEHGLRARMRPKRWMLVVIWVGWPLVIAGLVVETFYSIFPVAGVVLALAYLPANASSNLMLTSARTRFGWRASLDLLSAVALSAVLVAEHPALPFWLTLLGTAAAILSIVSGVAALVAWRQRRKVASC